ncbi:MAG: hypothetical protein IPK82_42665 [Polyangiaceae bacterium]|nr:hypothetical protein [Polyangiaceae bacterium]
MPRKQGKSSAARRVLYSLGMNTYRSSSSQHRFFHTGALSLLVALGLFTTACDGDETSGSAGSTTGGSGGSTTSTSSSGGAGGTGGMPMNPDPCDAVNNNCVEAEASKCTLSVDSAGAVEAHCEAPLGDAQLGEDCERPEDEFGQDTCAPGLLCAKYAKPKTDPVTRACMTLCDSANACSADEACIAFFDFSYGVCGQQCEPFTGPCGADPTQVCRLGVNVDHENILFCGQIGSKKLGDACTSNEDCGQDQACFGSAAAGYFCRSMCDDAHLCDTPSDACVLFQSPSEKVFKFGACVPSDVSCLGSVVWDPPANADAEVTIAASDFITLGPLPGAIVKACSKDDAMCAAPIAQATADAGGIAKVTVPTVGAGFDGYFEVTSAGSLPTLMYINQPVIAPLELFTFLGPLDVVNDLFVSPVSIDPSRGFFSGSVFGCTGDYLGGAVFSIEPADASTVLGHALPSFTAPVLLPNTIDPALTSSQAGGYAAVNVPVGKAKVTATTIDGKVVADLDVWSRAGTATVTILSPAP